jgi:hypothetical protein
VATLCVAGALSLVAATSATAQIGTSTPTTSANTIVVIATGQAEVKAANRNSNASIRAAVLDAQRTATPRGIINARVSAAVVGNAAGLTVGAIISVEDQSLFYSPGFNYQFGLNQYCGKVPRRRVVRDADGKRKVIRLPARRRCNVPEYAITTIKVTFAATPGPVVPLAR